MPGSLDLFVFVDALGWELACERQVLSRVCTHRFPLESVLGYSCACIPTILTGVKPAQHGHFAFYRKIDGASPFHGLEWLDRIPAWLSRRSRVRGWLSRFLATRLGFTGYFNLYNVPFRMLPLLDYSEKRDLFRPGGILAGAPTLFDDLEHRRIPHFVADWHAGESDRFRCLEAVVRRGEIRAAYLHLGRLDAVLHRDGTHSTAVERQVREYDEKLTRLLDVAGGRYQDVRLHVFSDHGMADITELTDVEGLLAARGLAQGRDYLGVFDSTMARFWVLDERAGPRLSEALRSLGTGRLLDAGDLDRFGCAFPGREYGELIYLVQPGAMIFPNFMGAAHVAGMHGYDPGHRVSLASYLGTHPPPAPPRGLWDLKALMLSSCERTDAPSAAAPRREPARATRPWHIVQIPRRFVRSTWGGTETLVLETSRCLRRLGHEVEVYTTRALADSDTELIEGIPVHRFAHFFPYLGLGAHRRAQLDFKGGNPFSAALMAALLRERPLDLIHLHTGKRLGGGARWAARRRGIPYVVTINGGVYDVPPEELESMLAPTRGTLEWGKVLGWWVGSRRVMEDASAIICVGRREQELVEERFPGKRVVYIPNGVDWSRFSRGDGAAFRRRSGIPATDRIVLCVGRIDPQKNQLSLVRLLPRLRALLPGIRVVLVGPTTDASYLERIRACAREIGVEDALTLSGAIGSGSCDLADAYHAADVFVLPSRHEPFGIVVLEAWAAGRPVVASRVGGLPGFMRNGEDGLLVPPSDDDAMVDAVRRLVTDRDLAGRLAAAGERRSRVEFSWTTCTEQLLSVYQEALASRA